MMYLWFKIEGSLLSWQRCLVGRRDGYFAFYSGTSREGHKEGREEVGYV